MNTAQKSFLGILLTASISSCSVQQFPVNTEIAPFEHGGHFFGEKTKDLEFKKSGDLHLIGINVLKSDVDALVEQLHTESYTIETKSNLWLNIVTLGLVDYKIVKVINRAP